MEEEIYRFFTEIYKRKLYEKKNCGSIFEFAAKFGGLSNDQVRLALNLEEKFTKDAKIARGTCNWRSKYQ